MEVVPEREEEGGTFQETGEDGEAKAGQDTETCIFIALVQNDSNEAIQIQSPVNWDCAMN